MAKSFHTTILCVSIWCTRFKQDANIITPVLCLDAIYLIVQLYDFDFKIVLQRQPGHKVLC